VQLSWKSNHGISIWVLQDLDTQEWVLKGRLSNMELSRKRNYIEMLITLWPRCIQIPTCFSLFNAGIARWYRMTLTVRKFTLSTPTSIMTMRLLHMFHTYRSYFSESLVRWSQVSYIITLEVSLREHLSVSLVWIYLHCSAWSSYNVGISKI
jgi:hypothetical protein